MDNDFGWLNAVWCSLAPFDLTYNIACLSSTYSRHSPNHALIRNLPIDSYYISPPTTTAVNDAVLTWQAFSASFRVAYSRKPTPVPICVAGSNRIRAFRISPNALNLFSKSRFVHVFGRPYINWHFKKTSLDKSGLLPLYRDWYCAFARLTAASRQPWASYVRFDIDLAFWLPSQHQPRSPYRWSHSHSCNPFADVE